jgi:hypothetical protein
MAIGDSIGKAAENAMEDLAGTSSPNQNPEVPEPTDPNSDVELHSSISEGSNAMEAERQKAPGLKPGSATGPVSSNPVPDSNAAGAGGPEDGPGSTGQDPDTAPDAADAPAATDVPRDVPGPAGLPEGDPGSLRADPGEGDEDPSTDLGRS